MRTVSQRSVLGPIAFCRTLMIHALLRLGAPVKGEILELIWLTKCGEVRVYAKKEEGSILEEKVCYLHSQVEERENHPSTRIRKIYIFPA